MDKLKAFFDNKIVKIVCWVILALVSVILIIGGVGVAEISTGVELVSGVITAVSALIIFISNLVNKKKQFSFCISLSWEGGASCEPSLFFFTNKKERYINANQNIKQKPII